MRHPGCRPESRLGHDPGRARAHPQPPRRRPGLQGRRQGDRRRRRNDPRTAHRRAQSEEGARAIGPEKELEPGPPAAVGGADEAYVRGGCGAPPVRWTAARGGASAGARGGGADLRAPPGLAWEAPVTEPSRAPRALEFESRSEVVGEAAAPGGGGSWDRSVLRGPRGGQEGVPRATSGERRPSLRRWGGVVESGRPACCGRP